MAVSLSFNLSLDLHFSSLAALIRIEESVVKFLMELNLSSVLRETYGLFCSSVLRNLSCRKLAVSIERERGSKSEFGNERF